MSYFTNDMTTLTIKTQKKKQVVDITDEVNKILKQVQDDKKVEGPLRQAQGGSVVNLFITHTTAALTAADLDPGTDLDMLDAFEAMMPKLNYRHPHNPAHAPDHILSAIIGTSLTIPYKNGALVLGAWQRVVLIEFDGPRERKIVVTFV